jgi:hypothetical protein
VGKDRRTLYNIFIYCRVRLVPEVLARARLATALLYDGGAGDGDGGRLGAGADLRICPGEAELWGG